MAENLIDSFSTWLQEQDHPNTTVRTYVSVLRKFAAWFERNGQPLTPTAVTPLDIREYRRYLSETRHREPATVNRHLAALRAFSRWAKATGQARHDPLIGIKGIEEVEHAPHWLTRSEQFRLLRQAQEEIQQGERRAQDDHTAPGYIWAKRDYALVALLLSTGLRLSEIAAATLDDVTINSRSGEFVVRLGKGRKKRTLPLNKSARKALNAWLTVRPESESQALFLSQKGGALSQRAIAAQVSALADRAGLKDVHVHALRHSFAKNLVDAGVGLEKVAQMLGHKNLNTTRIYTTPSQADLQEAAEKIAWED